MRRTASCWRQDGLSCKCNVLYIAVRCMNSAIGEWSLCLGGAGEASLAGDAKGVYPPGHAGPCSIGIRHGLWPLPGCLHAVLVSGAF
jgi:hypothetical protein